MRIQTITSKQNPRYRRALKLHLSRGRKQQQRIIVYGQREVERAILSGVLPVELFVAEGGADTEPIRNLVSTLEQGKAPSCEIIVLPEELYTELAFGSRVDPVVAVCPRPVTRLDQLDLPKNPVVVVLEAIEKPGNIGAVARSCDGAGVDAMLLANAISDPFHPNAIRASMGAVFSLPIAMEAAETIQTFLLERGIGPFVTRPDAKHRYDQVDWREPAAIVLGNEASGLSPCWDSPDCIPISIPMRGVADSLNVSVASAVVTYEAMRQRGFNAAKE